MWHLGRRHQVMCVTHLPQLAAFGDEHYRVSKQVSGERTLTGVEKLKGGEREKELAQMAGSTGDTGLKAAGELVLRARQKQAAAP